MRHDNDNLFEPVTLALDGDEALVLFELLSRSGSADEEPALPSESLESLAEQAILNNLLCLLERELVAPFRDDYLERVAAARASLIERSRIAIDL